MNSHDKTLLRELFKQLLQLHADLAPVMAEREARWIRSNRREPGRPPVIHGHEYNDFQKVILPRSGLQCTDMALHDIEYELRAQLYLLRNSVGDAYWGAHSTPYRKGVYEVPKVVRDSGWGLPFAHHDSTEEGGAWGFDPQIKTAADLKKIRTPELTVDEVASRQQLETVQELFGDLTLVRPARGSIRMMSFHLTGLYCHWRGLEQIYIDMVDNPEMLHEAMSILEMGYRQMLKQMVDLNLLQLNNHSYIFATDLLPPADCNPDRVRPCDTWTWTEAQELTSVSPEMQWEFSMQYEARLVEPFGLSSYGCCEDLTNKIEYVARLPHMHQLGVTPWADVKKCVEQIGTRFVISWRPNPSFLAQDTFNEGVIRAYLRENLQTLKGTAFHVFLKDTQTSRNEPWRYTRWMQICEEEIAAIWGPSLEKTDGIWKRDLE